MITYKIVNSVGLFLDIIGAWFIAFEVVKQYKGQKFFVEAQTWDDTFGKYPEELPEYTAWEKSKYIKMWIGLFLLTIGFSLQIYSNLFLQGNKNNVIITNDTKNIVSPITETKEAPIILLDNIPTKPMQNIESNNIDLKQLKSVTEVK
ncbi:MAG TPA: hypothetical protein ENH82_02620 [bacterium]|nr:hypothetical protein [bacterium]